MHSASASKRVLKLERALRPPRRVQDNLTIALFLLPALTLFLLFVVYPIFQSIYYSLFNWKGFGPAVDFVGPENFQNILTDSVFLIAIRNGLLIVGFSLVFQLPLSLALAVLVGRDLPGRVFFRTIFFMPYVLSEVITAIMWLFLYNPDPERGFINAILVLIPGGEAQTWLANTDIVLPAIFMALTWKYFGFHMLLYLAGLQNIPDYLYEAALIEGASPAHRLRYVTLPILAPTTWVVEPLVRTTVQTA